MTGRCCYGSSTHRDQCLEMLTTVYLSHSVITITFYKDHKNRFGFGSKHIPDTQCMCILKQPWLLPSGHGLCSSWSLPAFWHSSAGTGTSGAHGPYLMLHLKKLYRDVVSTTPRWRWWAMNWERLWNLAQKQTRPSEKWMDRQNKESAMRLKAILKTPTPASSTTNV